mgnify:CR=1 FL=1
MSTLSVNNITTQNGNIITVPSGKLLASPGLPIQTVLGQDETGLVMDATGVGLRFMNVPITTKVANSTFLIRFHAAAYSAQAAAGSYDVDMCAAMGFKTGAASTSSTDYTAITTYSPTRENITFANSTTAAFFATDTLGFNPNYAGYLPITTLYNEDTFAPNQAAGTVINVACFVKVDGATYWRIGSVHTGMADMGTVSTLTITEFAP